MNVALVKNTITPKLNWILDKIEDKTEPGLAAFYDTWPGNRSLHTHIYTNTYTDHDKLIATSAPPYHKKHSETAKPVAL